jgi:hypothetical protein
MTAITIMIVFSNTVTRPYATGAARLGVIFFGSDFRPRSWFALMFSSSLCSSLCDDVWP